jgi:hypothetical protein
MQDLGFAIGGALAWFPQAQAAPYVLIQVTEQVANALAGHLKVPVRRCYVTDEIVQDRAAATNVPEAQIIAAKLPDPGSTMAGDFGEILTYFYVAATHHPAVPFGPKKWRLKQDRTKPAPYSDVVQFLLPNWPAATAADTVVCSEVKMKSTPGDTDPIASALADSAKDKTSRLAKTLAWLKDRALVEDLGTVQLAHIERFLHPETRPRSNKVFNAVAVICSSLVVPELAKVPAPLPPGQKLIVIAVPNLRDKYMEVYAAAGLWP